MLARGLFTDRGPQFTLSSMPHLRASQAETSRHSTARFSLDGRSLSRYLDPPISSGIGQPPWHLGMDGCAGVPPSSSPMPSDCTSRSSLCATKRMSIIPTWGWLTRSTRCSTGSHLPTPKPASTGCTRPARGRIRGALRHAGARPHLVAGVVATAAFPESSDLPDNEAAALS